MKICIIGHSLVHPRQYMFIDYLRKNYDVDILEIYPSSWGLQRRKGGFQVEKEGDLNNYYFTDVFKTIEEFNPDIIYAMNEVYCEVTKRARGWANLIGSKFAYFCWENKIKTEPIVADLIIAGSKAAKHLNGANVIIPQVGINTDLFKPLDIEKKYNCIYAGRLTHEKGIDYIKEAYPPTQFFTGQGYVNMPMIFNSSKLFVSYPYETEYWKEQSCGYTVLEALSCGVPCVVSDCGAIPEYLNKCKAVTIVPQKNTQALKKAIEENLNNPKDSKKARDFVLKHYSYKIIGDKLINAFKEIM